jgi:hypothetical protein
MASRGRSIFWENEKMNETAIFQRLLAASSVALSMTLLAQSAIAASGHVHGQAELEVAVEGATLTVTLRSPLDSLLGFERAPRTAAQKAAAETLLQRLRDPAALFKPSAAASCAPVSTEIDAPVLGVGPAGAAGTKQADKDAHAELVSTMRFRCEQPAQLRALDVALFEQYRRLHRIEARIVGPRGQSSARLTPARRTLNW